MDRWHIEVSEQTGTQESDEVEDKIPYNIINNYFSIGVVSIITLLCFIIPTIINYNLSIYISDPYSSGSALC